MFVLISTTILCLPLSVSPSFGDPNTLIMEHEEEICKGCTGDYDTAFMNSVVVGNADTDANIEIVTVGTNKDSGDVSVFEWDGVSLEEETFAPGEPPTEEPGFTFRAVTLGDVTGSGYVDIITTGEYYDAEEGKHKGFVKVYDYIPGGYLATAANVIWDEEWLGDPYDDVYPTDVAVSYLDDNDGQVEIVTGARVLQDGQWLYEIRVWHTNLMHIVTEGSVILQRSGGVGGPHIDIGDIDDDPLDEIVIAVDYADNPFWRKGYLCAYDYRVENGLNNPPKYEYEWAEGSHTRVSSIALGDIDTDPDTEIVVVGSNHEDWSNAKIWTFYWNSGTDDVEEEIRHTWYDSWVGDVWIGNADSDTDIEIVTSGSYFEAISDVTRGQVGVWHSTGTEIEQEVLHDFGQLTRSFSVFVGDADGDSEVEIVTVGHRRYVGSPDPAILEIWTWNTFPPPQFDDWPMFHHDMANAGRSWSAAPGLKNHVASYTHTHSSGQYSHTSVSPIVKDGIVLTAVDDVVYAFDTSINYLWSVRLIPEDPGFTYATARSLAAGNDRVFYGTADLSLVQPPINGVLVALDLQGNELWRRDDFLAEFPGPPMTPWGERLFAPTIQLHYWDPPGRLLCLDATDGTEIWRFEPGKNIWASVAIYGTSVFVKAEEDLYSIPIEDPNGDGVITIPDEINWVFHMRRPGTASMIEFAGSPMVTMDHVFVGSPDGYLYSLPVEDPTPVLSPKEIVWTDIDWESPQLGDYVASTPAMPWAQPITGALFVGANWRTDIPRPYYGNLYRLRPDNGQILATYSFLTGPKTSSPAVADGKVFIWAEENGESYLYAFDDNLNYLWMHLVDEGAYGPQYPQGTSPAIADSQVFVGNGRDRWSNSFQPGHEGFIFAIWE